MALPSQLQRWPFAVMTTVLDTAGRRVPLRLVLVRMLDVDSQQCYTAFGPVGVQLAPPLAAWSVPPQPPEVIIHVYTEIDDQGVCRFGRPQPMQWTNN